MRKFKRNLRRLEGEAWLGGITATAAMLAVLALVFILGPALVPAGAFAFLPLVPLFGAALAADRDTRTINKPGLKGYKVLNNTTIFKGSMVAINAAGWLVPAANTAGLIVVGVADEQVVSPSTDAAGDKTCRVRSGELYEFVATSITQAMVGDPMYIADDQTFDDTATNDVLAGILVEFISATKGFIHIATPTGAITEIQTSGFVVGIGDGLKLARGQHTTVAASDTVVTGLATVVSVVAVLDDDPVAGMQKATSSIGDQAGTPAAGSILIKGWKATSGVDTAVIAATTFGKKVNWVAVGT